MPYQVLRFRDAKNKWNYRLCIEDHPMGQHWKEFFNGQTSKKEPNYGGWPIEDMHHMVRLAQSVGEYIEINHFNKKVQYKRPIGIVKQLNDLKRRNYKIIKHKEPKPVKKEETFLVIEDQKNVSTVQSQSVRQDSKEDQRKEVEIPAAGQQGQQRSATEVAKSSTTGVLKPLKWAF
jgi:hypothetical protein